MKVSYTSKAISYNSYNQPFLIEKPAVSNSNPAFGHNTSAGNPIKKLSDISCAYLGIKTIQGSTMGKLEKILDAKGSTAEAIELLTNYKDNLLDIERKMYDKFLAFSLEFPKAKFTDYLKKIADDCLTKLKLEELFVLDEMDMISRNLSSKTALTFRKKTTRCRDIILSDKAEETFKRKTLLESLDEIKPVNGEEKILDSIKDKAFYLPTSGSSENAFVIKYLNRSHEEIAKRLLRASVMTIEHVKPDSLGGKNEISNFVGVCASANSYRSNMPLEKYMERFSKVPENCQKYINDIIGKIHKGKLGGYETYPYDIKRTLQNESGGKIVLDLTGYQYSEEEAIKAKLSKNKKLKYNNIKKNE